MIRLLIISITFFLLYLGFTTLNQLDSTLTINFYDYHLETSFFTFISLYILLTILSLIVIKIILLIIDFPIILKKIFSVKKAGNVNYMLMKAMAQSIIGDKSQSLVMIKKIAGYLSEENRIFYILLLAESEKEIDTKIKYLQQLEQSKHYTSFVNKKLAQLYYQNNMYEQSENYAVRSFNLNESDSEILEILIDCYAKLSLWTKFVFVVSKLAKIDKEKLQSIKEKISNYYFLAANNMVETNDDRTAIQYLESAIKIVPSNYQALNLYFSLNSSSKNSKNIEMLKNAFIKKPSFEIVQIYREFTLMPSSEIYEDLAILVDPKEYFGLFLAIASYLNLPEKIKILKNEPKLLPFYQME